MNSYKNRPIMLIAVDYFIIDFFSPMRYYSPALIPLFPNQSFSLNFVQKELHS